MSDRAALVAACLAAPQDNTPRLVYADWLEEYGDTERDAAVRDWIRMSCSKVRRGPTRMRGEPAWIHKHLRVLWPGLYTSSGKVTLATQKVLFRVRIPNTGVCSIVTLETSRGVTSGAVVPPSRAWYTAPLCATDEPLAPVRFTHVPGQAVLARWVSNARFVFVYKQWFSAYGLSEVFDLVEGGELGETEGIPVKMFGYSVFGDSTRHVAVNAVNTALTRWARTVAGVPAFPLIRPPAPRESDPEPVGDKVTVPPRVPSRPAGRPLIEILDEG